MSQTLLGSRWRSFTAFALREQYYRPGSENEDSDPDGPHKHPPTVGLLFFYFRPAGCEFLTSEKITTGFSSIFQCFATPRMSALWRRKVSVAAYRDLGNLLNIARASLRNRT